MILLRFLAVFLAGTALWAALSLYAVACGPWSARNDRAARVHAYATDWGQRAADWVYPERKDRP